MKIKILSLLFFAIFSANGQIRITQVDPTTDKITIHNYGGATVNIGSYWLCTQITYQQLSTITPESGSFNLAAGADVTLITTTIALNNTAADLGLYNAFDFTNTSAMLDFMQWGGSFDFPLGRENVAVSKGIWGDEDFITISSPFQYNGNGAQNGESFWESVLSIEDFHLSDFTISPNPSHSFIKLNFSVSTIQATVKVFDILGKQVYSTKNILDSEINVSNWNTGMYLIKASSFGNIKTKRFIKQ